MGDVTSGVFRLAFLKLQTSLVRCFATVKTTPLEPSVRANVSFRIRYICDHIASVMASDMLNEFRKLEITFQESLKQTVSVIMKTVHEEKARIETGKRTSLQRKFTRPPFQNVALNFMTNVCRLKITFANQRIEMKLSQTNAPFFHADETNKIAYSNVVTRAAAKRLRSSDQEKNDVFEDRSRQNVQYLIKRRKMQLSQHQSLIKSHNSSSFTCHNPNSFGNMDDSDDLVSQMIANRKKRILFCQGVTKWGKRCTRRPCHNSKYCNKHKQQK